MSNFIVAFIASYVAITVFLIFGGYNILNNIFLLIGFISLVLAIFITAIIKLYIKSEELEKRIEELEKYKKDWNFKVKLNSLLKNTLWYV